MNGLKRDVGKKAKGLAKHTAKKMAQEPFEVLKTAERQTVGVSPDVEPPIPPSDSAEVTEEEKKKIEERGVRTLSALEKELEDIRLQRLRKEREEKVAQERAKLEKKEKEGAKKGELREPTTKRKRGLLGGFIKGMKGKIERLRRKSEIRMPPSG